MVNYDLYELDSHNQLKLVDTSENLAQLCEENEIPDNDISFAMRICNGEYVYNNKLISKHTS